MTASKPISSRCIAAGLIPVVSQAAGAADEALLQVLLSNKLITQQQYDAFATVEQTKAAGPAASSRVLTLPRQEDGLLDVLLANSVLAQAQYAALQVGNAEERAKRQASEEATVTLMATPGASRYPSAWRPSAAPGTSPSWSAVCRSHS